MENRGALENQTQGSNECFSKFVQPLRRGRMPVDEFLQRKRAVDETGKRRKNALALVDNSRNFCLDFLFELPRVNKIERKPRNHIFFSLSEKFPNPGHFASADPVTQLTAGYECKAGQMTPPSPLRENPRVTRHTHY